MGLAERMRDARDERDPARLAGLSASPEVEVRQEVAYNRAAPPHVLARLMDDLGYGVRLGAATNPSARLPWKRAVSFEVAEDDDPDIKLALVRMMVLAVDVPSDWLEKLVREAILDLSQYDEDGDDLGRGRDDLATLDVESQVADLVSNLGPWQIRDLLLARAAIPEVVQTLVATTDWGEPEW